MFDVNVLMAQNGGNMQSWGIRSNSQSSNKALDASHNP